MSQEEQTYQGQCFCGAVTIEVPGEAAGAGYCHCKNCRSWSAGPVNAFTLWPTDAVEVTGGASTSASSTRPSRASASGAPSAAGI